MKQLGKRAARFLLRRVAKVAGRVRPNWSPDVATRYLPIARIVRGAVGRRGTVLDVGAGGLGIGAYLANPCVTTDLAPPVKRNASFVRANATRLPFADRSFDAVVQADVMEHLEPSIRFAVTNEMFRVARKLVIVAAPTGARAEAHDRRLADEVNPRNHLRSFLAEHFEYGLPTEADLVALMRTCAAGRFNAPVVTIMRNANLALRYVMMRGIVRAEDADVETLVRLWAPMGPLFAAYRFGACYRSIVACRDGSGG